MRRRYKGEAAIPIKAGLRQHCIICGQSTPFTHYYQGDWYPFCCTVHLDELYEIDPYWLPLIKVTIEATYAHPR